MISPPKSIDVGRDELVVEWSDDHISRYDLVKLRRQCTCAFCVDQRKRDQPVWPGPDAPERLGVEGAELVGAWGLNLRWNDRHETGVYAWDTLRAWCDCSHCASAETPS